MTPKEKAVDLLNKIELVLSGDIPETLDEYYQDSKDCALVIVDEITIALYSYLKNTDELQNADREFAYWDSVKKEIEVL